MKKQEKILKNIESNKEIIKNIKSLNYYSISQFIGDCERYIKAIKEGRIIVNVVSVSSSGMSRRLKFLACERARRIKEVKYNYCNYNCFLNSLGYKTRNSDFSFNVSGCGMDMIFSTNYDIIHSLFNLGFLNKKQCDRLAQKTPSYI